LGQADDSTVAEEAVMGVSVEIADALITSLNTGDMDRISELFADGCVGIDVAEPAPLYGSDAIRRSVVRYREAFPDLRFAASATVTDEDRIALFWVAKGTHRGPLMHIPPTGRPFEVRGVSLLRIDEGKIAEALYLWDVAGLLRAVGLLPELSVDLKV
jgi:steroid delta-isomerase-like uncharacterized protein